MNIHVQFNIRASLDGADERVRRAGEHLIDLKGRINTLEKSKLDQVVVERKPALIKMPEPLAYFFEVSQVGIKQASACCNLAVDAIGRNSSERSPTRINTVHSLSSPRRWPSTFQKVAQKEIIAGEEVNVKPELSVPVIFSGGLPVIETLEQLASQVAQTLDAFKPEFQI